MASIILGEIAGNIGNAAYGELGSVIGQNLGSMIGRQIDQSNNKQSTKIQGRRLTDLNIQTSTYGRMIPIIYGTFKIAGNIIWGRPISENIIDEEVSESKFDSYISRNYNYSVTLAIAICEGEIDSIERIWVNDKLFNMAALSYFKLHNGSETQMPDSLIESFTGIGQTPAYRGISYIVIENFNLDPYHGRIPNFTFEVKRTLKNVNIQGENLENMIESMIVIPGSGEFVYDTIIQSKISGVEIEGKFFQQGPAQSINKHTYHNESNAIVSLNQLLSTCKNLKWIAPVVTWFTDNVELKRCNIIPAVEYNDKTRTFPDQWKVAGYRRKNAYLISKDKDGNPNYGGSVNDQSVLRFLDELSKRNLKIMFYPMFFVDTPGKPWRGRLTGDANMVENFFRKPKGYNEFILHYANLVKDKVDAFIIGSELIGLTKIKDRYNNFPAVKELILLAEKVKNIMGSKTLISYAADWSEYHHTDGGWYNLDELWSSKFIDFIGIDAYFPLTDKSINKYNIDQIKEGWSKGEGYDYYLDNNSKKELPPEYAWKNIKWWWENYHKNPDGKYTNWRPKSKKIWFTEYGYPSVDAAPNQPNVFYDPKSIEGNIPTGSNGKIDFSIQRKSLQATEEYWKNSEFLENKFVWTWDMRPYPTWPDLKNIWRDHDLWSRGHWVSGKLGITSLAAIVSDLCNKANLDRFDVASLEGDVDGYAITHQQTIKDSIEILQSAYFFDSIYSNDKLVMLHSNYIITNIDLEDLASNDKQKINTQIIGELDLPSKIEIGFINKYFDYEEGLESAQKHLTNSSEVINISLPIVMGDRKAKEVAEIKLSNSWTNRIIVDFILPLKYIFLEVGDIVNFNNDRQIFKIIQLSIIESRQVKIIAILVNNLNLNFKSNIEIDYLQTDKMHTKGDIINHIIKLSDKLFIAACSSSGYWSNANLFISDNNGSSYRNILKINRQSVIGNVCGILNKFSITKNNNIDNITRLEIVLLYGKLHSADDSELSMGKNMALIGKEIIQFKKSEFIEPHKYIISDIIRGKYNTDKFMNEHLNGEKFILLNDSLYKMEIPKASENRKILYKIIDQNQNLNDVEGKFLPDQNENIELDITK